MIRPSPVRVGGIALFGLICLIPALADGVSLIGRIAGWMIICGSSAAVLASTRTWIRIDEGGVEIGGVRGSKVFRAGRASVREFAVPGGVVRDGKAVHIEGVDGSSATVALYLFRREDRADLGRRLRQALKDDR